MTRHLPVGQLRCHPFAIAPFSSFQSARLPDAFPCAPTHTLARTRTLRRRRAQALTWQRESFILRSVAALAARRPVLAALPWRAHVAMPLSSCPYVFALALRSALAGGEEDENCHDAPPLTVLRRTRFPCGSLCSHALSLPMQCKTSPRAARPEERPEERRRGLRR